MEEWNERNRNNGRRWERGRLQGESERESEWHLDSVMNYVASSSTDSWFNQTSSLSSFHLQRNISRQPSCQMLGSPFRCLFKHCKSPLACELVAFFAIFLKKEREESKHPRMRKDCKLKGGRCCFGPTETGKERRRKEMKSEKMWARKRQAGKKRQLQQPPANPESLSVSSPWENTKRVWHFTQTHRESKWDTKTSATSPLILCLFPLPLSTKRREEKWEEKNMKRSSSEALYPGFRMF